MKLFWKPTLQNLKISSIKQLESGFLKSPNFLTECFILYFLPLNSIVHRIRVKNILEKMNFVNVVLVFVYLV